MMEKGQFSGSSRFEIQADRRICLCLKPKTGASLAPVLTVKEILGHKDIKMTLRYVHPTPENKREAMDCLAEFATDLPLDRSEGKVVAL
jgi:hypothetical protein